MPVLDAKLLDAGKNLISRALLSVDKLYPYSFVVGDEAGFTPVSTDLAVRGNTVYTGYANNISVNQIAEDTIRYVCNITELVGPFTVGNIIMHLDDGFGNAAPFIEVVLPVTVYKKQSDTSFTSDGYAVPGTRLAISIELKHSQEIEITSIDIITPTYSSLPTFGTEGEVPLGAALTHKQFVVSYDTRTKGPVMFTVDANNVRWGMPFTHQINDPNFGHLLGGTDGEGYGGESDDILTGGYYLTPDTVYSSTYLGGWPYSSVYLVSIGNATYTNTSNYGTIQI